MSKIAGGFLAASFLVVTGAWGQLNYATPYNFVTLAGVNGSLGSQDGTNSGALFNQPFGLALGATGNVYVVDYEEDTVRQMTLAGTNWVVTTIAGTAGNFGSNEGTNGTIDFDEPTDIAVDAGGNLYVTDANNNALRKLTRTGTNWVSSTIAGNFNFPFGLAVDAKTNIYIADTFNNVIRRVSPVGANWVTTTIAGNLGDADFQDGTNSSALFNDPTSLAMDGSGNIFVADSGNFAIRKMTPMGTNWVVTTIAGSPNSTPGTDGTNEAAGFFSVVLEVNIMAVAVDANDNVYVADGGDALIRKVSPVGTNWVTTTLAGSMVSGNVTDGTGTNAVFGEPSGIAVNTAGRLFVSDTGADDMRAGSLAPAPALTLSMIASNKVAGVMVAWPTSGGFTLQTNMDLRTANWGDYNGPVNTTNAVSSLSVLPTTGNVFFRLVN